MEGLIGSLSILLGNTWVFGCYQEIYCVTTLIHWVDI